MNRRNERRLGRRRQHRYKMFNLSKSASS